MVVTRFTLTEDELDAVFAVVHAASKDRVLRPVLGGVHVRDGWVMATDFYRLAAHVCEVDAPPFFIGADAVKDLPVEGDCTFTLTTESLAWTVAGTRYSTLQHAPDTKPLGWWKFCDPRPHRVTIDREGLLAALKGVEPFVSYKTTSNKVAGFVVLASSHAISGRLSVGGVTVETLAAVGYVPSVAVNRAFLTDALRHLTGVVVTIEVSEPLKPVLMQEGQHIEVIMPVRNDKLPEFYAATVGKKLVDS